MWANYFNRMFWLYFLVVGGKPSLGTAGRWKWVSCCWGPCFCCKAVSTHHSALHPARKLCLKRWQSSHTSMFAAPQGFGQHGPLMPMQRKTTPKLICVSVTLQQSELCSKRNNSGLLCKSTSMTKGSALIWDSQKTSSDVNIKGTPLLIVTSTFWQQRGIGKPLGEKHSRTNIPVLVFVNILNIFCTGHLVLFNLGNTRAHF